MRYNYIYSSNKKSQNSNFIKKLIIHDTPYITGLRTLSHTPQGQVRTKLKTSTDNHFSCCHSHQLLGGGVKPDTISTWPWVVYVDDVGVRMTQKGVDHFGDCFVRVRPINRLFSCKYGTFGQMSGLSTYFPFSLAFYFAIMDPCTGPTRWLISTNQRREMLLFLARIFVSHAGITNNGSAHTDSAVLSFLVQSPNSKMVVRVPTG